VPTTGCPPCDGTYRCTVTQTGGGTPQQATFTLKTTDGQCVAAGNIVLACGGQITQNGSTLGMWSNCAKTTTGGDAGN